MTDADTAAATGQAAADGTTANPEPERFPSSGLVVFAQKEYLEASDRASTVARSLALSLLALVWLFAATARTTANAESILGYIRIHHLLFGALLAGIFSLAADFLQYALAAVCYGLYLWASRRLVDKRDDGWLAFLVWYFTGTLTASAQLFGTESHFYQFRKKKAAVKCGLKTAYGAAAFDVAVGPERLPLVQNVFFLGKLVGVGVGFVLLGIFVL